MNTVRLLAAAGALIFAATSALPAPKEIYPDPALAKSEIAAALKTAAATHKRVLLDFGGNWCGDCQVLDIYLHNAENGPILDANFVLVDINIGKFDANEDIAMQYDIPLHKGVPAVAVLSASGKLLYSQKGGEFESMRHMQSSAVTHFLVQWKPVHAGCSMMVVDC